MDFVVRLPSLMKVITFGLEYSRENCCLIAVLPLLLKRLYGTLLSHRLFSPGDIERLRMQSAESEAEKQALRERIDQLVRSQQELESRATSLQLTVDRLTLALAKTEEEEQAFKEKVIEPFCIPYRRLSRLYLNVNLWD